MKNVTRKICKIAVPLVFCITPALSAVALCAWSSREKREGQLSSTRD
jgi:hypothetical protein